VNKGGENGYTYCYSRYCRTWFIFLAFFPSVKEDEMKIAKGVIMIATVVIAGFWIRHVLSTDKKK